MQCQRCGKSTVGYALHDYCFSCGKNLCEKCMAEGCCGAVPAVSGMHEDYGTDETAEKPEGEAEPTR